MREENLFVVVVVFFLASVFLPEKCLDIDRFIMLDKAFGKLGAASSGPDVCPREFACCRAACSLFAKFQFVA